MTGAALIRPMAMRVAGKVTGGAAAAALCILAACAWMGEAPAPPIQLVDIRAGERHTCVLTAGGGVKCWGNNHDSQLGDGTGNDHGKPVDVIGLKTGVAAMSAGWRHVCVVTTAGKVACWGNNHDGQLGDGTRVDRSKPEAVIGLLGQAKAVATGERHSCALMASGGVKCWGNNHDGELGDGTRMDRVTSLDVAGLTSGVTAITSGWRHTCALTEAGGVKCWGGNHEGQLGLGTRSDANVPRDVVGLTTGITAISAGWRHTCALASDGGVKCWGSNHSGQLGDGTGIDRKIPVDVVMVTGRSLAIAAGGQHTCAMDSNAITCWGENEDGQLGDGTFKSSLTGREQGG